MIIYSNGCSHTRIGEDFFSNSYPNIICQELFKNDYQTFDLNIIQENQNWIEILKNKHISNSIFKQSSYGKSNDLIFLETLRFIYTALNTEIKPNLLLIQWSGPNRRFHTTADGHILNVNLHDNVELGVKFEPIASEQTLQYMLVLQDLCKLHNIEYIFIPYMELDKKSINDIFLNQLDKSRITTSVLEGHRNYFRKNGFVMDVEGHPNFYGMYELSKIILDILGYEIKDISNYITKEDVEISKPKKDNFIKKYAYKIGDGVLDKLNEIKDLI